MQDRLNIAGKIWEWGKRTYIMGILNVTPDSFSDGGRYLEAHQALEHAEQMADEGADMIDVGGEATRPGFARPISAEEEIRRLIPVIRMLSEKIDLPLSADTYKAETAEMAVKAGADMINDIWGLKKDPDMALSWRRLYSFKPGACGEDKYIKFNSDTFLPETRLPEFHRIPGPAGFRSDS